MARAAGGEVVHHAAGDHHLTLTGGEVEPGAERLLTLDLHLDLVRTAGDRLPEPTDRQPVAQLQPVVCVGVDVERDEPLCDQVAAVDAGEALGEDAADPSCRGARAACSRLDPWP